MTPAAYYMSSIEQFVPYVPTEIQIGGQIWDQKNLNTSRYKDGTIIPQKTTGWGSAYGAWRYYSDLKSSGSLYGRLYNWYAVSGIYDTASLSDPLLRREIAPEGWRVATNDDWTTLSNYLGGDLVSGGKLKDTGFTYWTSPNTGATNTASFTALPGGAKTGTDSTTFQSIRVNGYWWTSDSGIGVRMDYDDDNLVRQSAINLNRGQSIRLIKNDIILPGFTSSIVGFTDALSATGSGEFTIGTSETILNKGICWGTLPNPNVVTSTTSSLGSGATPNPFSAIMSPLSASTTYYVRAYAVIPTGTAYATQVSFTTLTGEPVSITTAAASNIQYETSTSGGTVVDNTSYPTTERGVCWNTTGNPTVADFKTIDGSGPGTFESSLTGLSSNNTYYVRAYIKNAAGTFYGNEITFTTLAVGVLILDTYPSSHHAYSLRKLSTSYTGFCLRVRRTSGTSTEVNVGFDDSGTISFSSSISLASGTSTNAVNLGEFAEGTVDGLTAQSIFVVTWYDQSGNGKNPTQATAGQQPRLVNVVGGVATLETSGGKVAVRFVKSESDNLTMTDTTANINNMSSYWVGQFVSNTGSQIGYLLNASNRFYFPYSNGTNTFAAYSTSTVAIQLDAGVTTDRRLYELISPSPLNAAVAQGWTNGAAQGTRAIGNSAISNIQIGTGTTNYFDGYIQEVIGWQTNATRLEKETNINTYWTVYP